MPDDSMVTIKTGDLEWFLTAVDEVSLPHSTLVDIGVQYLERHFWTQLLPEEQRGPFLRESKAALAKSKNPLQEVERIEKETLSPLFEEGGSGDRRGSQPRRSGGRDRRR